MTAPKPRQPLTLVEVLRLGGTLLVFFVVGLLLLRWVTTPRYLGDTLAGWRAKLHAPAIETRRAALEALAHLPTDAQTVASLGQRVLDEDDAATRALALRVLHGSLTPARADLRRAALDNYLDLARSDSRPAIRHRATDALVSLVVLAQEPGDDALRRAYRPRVLALLLERTRTEIDEDRAALLAHLATVRPLPAEAEEPLLAAWRATRGDDRRAVVACLLGVTKLSPQSLPALLEQLPVADLEPGSVAHLQRLAPDAVPALRQELLTGPVAHRPVVARTLLALGNEGQAALVALLTSAAVGQVVVETFRADGANARPFLVTQRQHADAATRAAVEALLKAIPETPTERPK